MESPYCTIKKKTVEIGKVILNKGIVRFGPKTTIIGKPILKKEKSTSIYKKQTNAIIINFQTLD